MVRVSAFAASQGRRCCGIIGKNKVNVTNNFPQTTPMNAEKTKILRVDNKSPQPDETPQSP